MTPRQNTVIDISENRGTWLEPQVAQGIGLLRDLTTWECTVPSFLPGRPLLNEQISKWIK